MRLVVDMNLSPRWAVRLPELGIAAVHWSQVGDPRASDAAIMAWARAERRVVLTHDLDFVVALALAQARGPSVVLLRASDPAPFLSATLVAATIRAHAVELEAGAILVLDRTGNRVRMLPVRSQR